MIGAVASSAICASFIERALVEGDRMGEIYARRKRNACSIALRRPTSGADSIVADLDQIARKGGPIPDSARTAHRQHGRLAPFRECGPFRLLIAGLRRRFTANSNGLIIGRAAHATRFFYCRAGAVFVAPQDDLRLRWGRPFRASHAR